MELAGALRLLLLVLCSLLITSVFADSSSDEEPTTCTPGSTFPLDCNTCVCGDDGIRANAACTLKGCGTIQEVVVAEHADGVICNPLENFELGCNTCKCGSDGLVANAACTQNPCPRQLLSALSRKKRGGPMDGVLSERCFPGSPFKVDCNLCLCPVSGIKELAPCSDWVCPPPTCSPNDVECVSDGERCAPGITYMDECNMCICSQDGIKAHASCTFKLCPK
ncbi:pacifastin-like protease inhibitor cvp4 isoform X4 [Anabrus simplex]|uniref:pacifastin-like protease inhibitor cvp4 isoform X4 n=1 Tax=Anabrus simplex TaxID=316456 RepID=UPI0035A3BC69